MSIVRRTCLPMIACLLVAVAIPPASAQLTPEELAAGNDSPLIALDGPVPAIPLPQECPGVNLLVRFGSWANAYGGGAWGEMTVAIDTAAATVTTTAALTDLDFLNGFDALWVDAWDLVTNPFVAGEVDNIGAFAATGKRVVMIGENSGWTDWNNDITGVGGGSFGGNFSGGATGVAAAHELTTGVSAISVLNGGFAVGGTSLFNDNVATLWGENVLTFLDTNAQTNTSLGNEDNDAFFGNLVAWVACETPVEAPLGACIAGTSPELSVCIENVTEAQCDLVPAPVPSAWQEGADCSEYPGAGTCDSEALPEGVCVEAGSEAICVDDPVGGTFDAGAQCSGPPPPVPSVSRGGQVVLLTLLLAGASLLLVRRRIASGQA